MVSLSNTVGLEWDFEGLLFVVWTLHYYHDYYYYRFLRVIRDFLIEIQCRIKKKISLDEGNLIALQIPNVIQLDHYKLTE